MGSLGLRGLESVPCPQALRPAVSRQAGIPSPSLLAGLAEGSVVLGAPSGRSLLPFFHRTTKCRPSSRAWPSQRDPLIPLSHTWSALSVPRTPATLPSRAAAACWCLALATSESRSTSSLGLE